MNAKSLSIIILIGLLGSACAPAATPIASSSRTTIPQVQATQAYRPAPTQAPAFIQPEALPTQTAGYQPVAPQPTQAFAAQPAYPPPPGSVPTPVDNFFQGYGINPFVDAREDHLSTFALDVDTASYTVMRRYVEEGNLPPANPSASRSTSTTSIKATPTRITWLSVFTPMERHHPSRMTARCSCALACRGTRYQNGSASQLR